MLKFRDYRGPIAILLASVALTALVGRWVEYRTRSELDATTKIIAENLAANIDLWIDSHLGIINQLANGIDTDYSEKPEEFERLVKPILEYTSGFQAINWIDKNGIISVVVPLETNPGVLGVDLESHPRADVRNALERAKNDEKLYRTFADLPLLQGGIGMTTYRAVRDSRGALVGYVNGVFRVDTLRAEVFSGIHLEDRFNYRLTEEDNTPVFQSGLTTPSEIAGTEKSVLVNVADKRWRLTIFPTAKMINDWLGASKAPLRLGGAVCGLVLAFVSILLTRQKRSLERSEARFGKLSRATFEGVVIHDKGVVVDANQAFADMLGVELSSVIGQDVLQNWVPAEERENVLRHIRIGDEKPYESAAIREDGSIFPVEIRGWGLSLDGTALRVIVIHDITERKQAEEALRRSEQRLSLIYESVDDVLYLLAVGPDECYRFLSVNRRFMEATGLTSEQIVGKRIEEVISESSVCLVRDKYKMAIEENRLVRWEETTEYPAGEKVGAVSVAPIFDENGNCTHLVGAVHDITEQRKAQADKEESDARASAIVEHAVDGIITIDEAGLIESYNPAAETLFGFSRSEILGQNVRILMPEPYHSQHDGYIERYLKTGTPRIIGTAREVKGQRKDGTTFPMKLSVSDILFGERRILTGIVHDLTHESELERQLLQAQKLESLGTLAGGIAHDFNNILQSILGFCEMAQENANGNTELLTQCLQEIDTAGRRAADLVAQILTFSRATEVETKPLALQLLIEEANRFLRSSIPATIRMESKIDPDCPQVMANATQIHQIVTNLCTNAMHAMEEHPGVITVSLAPRSIDASLETLSGPLEPGEYVQLSVADSGTGIDPAVLQKVLDPFFTTKEVGKGTGLGLAMVHGIVTGMGGGLLIESELGTGTTVRVILPAVRESGALEQPQELPDRSAPKGSGHIMIVDDEETITKLSTLILEGRGFTVRAFNDAASALEAVEVDPKKYDVVLLDFTMPEKTGLELAQDFHSLNAKFPVLIMTGLLDKSKIARSMSPNVVEIINKPFSADTLVEAINRLL